MSFHILSKGNLFFLGQQGNIVDELGKKYLTHIKTNTQTDKNGRTPAAVLTTEILG